LEHLALIITAVLEQLLPSFAAPYLDLYYCVSVTNSSIKTERFKSAASACPLTCIIVNASKQRRAHTSWTVSLLCHELVYKDRTLQSSGVHTPLDCLSHSHARTHTHAHTHTGESSLNTHTERERDKHRDTHRETQTQTQTQTHTRTHTHTHTNTGESSSSLAARWPAPASSELRFRVLACDSSFPLYTLGTH